MQTAADRVQQYDTLAGDGLHRLTQISLLLLISAAVALAAATGAAIWQRRASFLDYRLQGYLPRQLWTALLIESGLDPRDRVCGSAPPPASTATCCWGGGCASRRAFPRRSSRPCSPRPRHSSLVVGIALLAIAPWSYRAVKAPRTGMT